MNQNCKNHIAKLKKLRVYGKFVKNLKDGNRGSSIEDYCDISETDTFNTFASGAFTFSDTPEGHGFWAKILNK